MTEVSFTITVMTCPQRAVRAAQLVAALNALGGAAVATVLDVSRLGPRACAARAWAGATIGTTHHMVLQDDAILCDDFIESVRRALEAAPADLISFFTSSPYVNLGAVPRLRKLAVFEGALALAAPSALARDVAGALEQATSQADDAVIGTFLRSRNLQYRVAIPNLVDHAPIPSTVGHQYQHSRTFLGAHVSGKDLTWEV